MTKLWPYEVGRKTGKLQQRREVVESCSNTASRRRDVSGLVLGRFSAQFEPKIGVFKLKHQEDKKRRLGLGEGDFVHTLGLRKRL